MKYSTPARNHQPMMSPLKLQNDLEFDNQQSLLISDSKISPSLVELKKPINSQDSSVMENLRKKIRNHATIR